MARWRIFNHRLCDDQRGASLAEAMVAAVILAVVMVAGTGYFFLPRNTIAAQSTKRMAVAEARNRMEFLVSLPFDTVSPDSNEVEKAVSLGHVIAYRTTVISEVDDAADGLGSDDADGDIVDYKKISVTLKWGENNKRTVRLETVISDISYETSTTTSTALSGWGRRCELVIQAAQVAGDLSDFPVLLTADNLPAEMLQKNGTYAALEDGGDIRFSADAAGTQQLACEVVSFEQNNDPARASAEIWVKVPELSSTSNTSIWVWYQKPNAVQPDADDTYGSNAVWQDYVLVYHMNGDPEQAAPQFIDRSGNGNDAYPPQNKPELRSSEDGLVGEAIEFDADFDYLHADDAASLDLGTQGTLEAWIRVGSFQDYDGVIHKGDLSDWSDEAYSLQLWPDERFVLYLAGRRGGRNLVSASQLEKKTWYHLAGTWDSGQAVLYLNGVQDATSPHVIAVRNTSGGVNIGAQITQTYTEDYENFPFDGRIDEVRISRVSRSAAWLRTGYLNQSSPADFVLPATPETP